jgi:hypothetical protein
MKIKTSFFWHLFSETAIRNGWDFEEDFDIFVLKMKDEVLDLVAFTAYGNAQITTSDGKFDQCAYFDGTGDYIKMPYDSDLDFGTGDYTVDWGDGVTENFASGIKAEHAYTYSAISESTLCSRGYKQVLISITPQVPGTLTSINLTSSHTNSLQAKNSFLDIVVAGINVNNISCSSLICLESFSFIGTNNIINFGSMFQGCTSLQSIPLLDTSQCAYFGSMFAGCSALQTIPLLNTSKGTNFSGMFANCTSLQSIPLLNTSLGTYFSNMFTSCYKLGKVVMTGTKFSISYMGCCLSRSAIIEIFNALGTAVSQTITITGCYGAASLTAEDKLIATDKGWTITI